ncbi:Breast cancer type 2 susceptibility protein homolog [Rhizoctonia solani]|uniref:Breast cancer type 2 susceptibility protein homolog n=1 Tax=Rhizoctonia solani TaxID=456999 RepID=A0A0K6FMJ1_9AGAM|nr:Breast cancer type 2 susceptibility protein homolog [Rhizoctonia solani]
MWLKATPSLMAVDDYDVFQPDTTHSGDPFEEVPSSQGETDGEYMIGKVRGECLSSQSEVTSPTFKRTNTTLGPPIPGKETPLEASDIDFGAYVLPDAVGFTSAGAALTDPSLPTFMPASQVAIDSAIPKPVARLNIKLAGGGGAIKPITAEEIRLSANKLMTYQQDTKWKPRPRNMPTPAPETNPIPPDENIDFGALVKPTSGFASDGGIPIFMSASQVPIDRSELASTSTLAKKSNIKLAGGTGALKPLTEGEIKASAEKLMSYQQDTKWKPQARTRLPRLTSASRAEDLGSPKLDPVDGDDSGIGLLEPVEAPGLTDAPIEPTSKGKQRAMLPHVDDTPRQGDDKPTISYRISENPFSSRPPLGTPVRSTPLFSTPVRPTPATRLSVQTPSEPLFSQSTPQTVPSTLYRLGLSQRKPNKGTGFTTPFKPGMAPGEKGRQMLPMRPNVPTPLKSATPLRASKGAGITGITRALEAEKEKQILERAVFDTRPNGERKTLRQAGFVPTGNRGSSAVPYLSLKAASTFSFPQGGHTEMLNALQDRGCTLADKEWVKNHWGQVIWKLSGLAHSGAEATEKWSWDEALRQMLYRYEREINRAERPAIRRIQEHDASPAQPMVLCVSNVQMGGEEVEIELTDGWYRIRTLADKALAGAAKKGKLAVGRKIAVTGARIEGGHEGKEVLKAYHSSTLKITGNSTSLARWDARLGFHRGPFVASLRSLSADGGSVALLDVIITKLFPIGFVETDEKGRSTRPFDQSSEDAAQRAWEERRSNEASKWQVQLEKRLERMKAATGRLRHLAKGASFNDEETPEDGESFLEEFEDAEYDLDMLKTRRFEPTLAAWLAIAVQAKCDEAYERREEEMERELARTCPPRKVRNFRVIVIKDARPLQKPTERTAQLTAWDVLGFAADTLCAGQRYLLANVQPSQPGSWRKNDFRGDIYLSTRRDTKWTAISDA